MSYFPYPTPPLRGDVLTLRGDAVAKREEMTQAEIEGYLASAEAQEDLDAMGTGARPEGDYEDGDGVKGQAKAE